MDENRVVMSGRNFFVTRDDIETFIDNFQKLAIQGKVSEKGAKRLNLLRENPELFSSILHDLIGDINLHYQKDDVIRDNYFICSWPINLVNYFLDTYFNYNLENISKLKKFDSHIDGYMSIANNIVKIWYNSRGFIEKEYQGRDEFYSEYEDIFNNFYEYFLSISVKENKVAIHAASEAKRRLEKCIKNRTLSYSELIVIFVKITAAIDLVNSKKTIYVVDVFSDEIIDHIMGIESKNISIVPFPSPRGAFGINTFLHLFFHGLGPVAVSINPLHVHKAGLESPGEYGTPFSVMTHDISHLTFGYSFSSGHSIDARKLTCLNYFINKCVYQYILSHQEEIGVEKCKGMLYVMFIDIHEGGSESFIYKEDFGDHWTVFERQRHYTPKRYKITLSGLIDSENLFATMYMRVAFKEMRKDLDEIKTLILKDINENGPISSRNNL